MILRIIDIKITFNRVERSSDQIIKPVNLAALTKWVGNIPEDVVREMADIAPMLSVLGYDPYANPPVYGAPDSLVSDNTRRYVRYYDKTDVFGIRLFVPLTLIHLRHFV